MSNTFRFDQAALFGWKLILDVGLEPRVSPEQLEIVTLQTDNEVGVDGYELAVRAQEKLDINLGQHQAESLLERADAIPESFRTHFLYFPGTRWKHKERQYMPYLRWKGKIKKWALGFAALWLTVPHSSRILRMREIT